MFDFLVLQNYSDNPSVLTILVTVLFSFFLSSLLVITYDFTTRGVKKPAHFMQSMILISIVAATVMQAIGDSLARGLGMLGALAIIRFRTRLNNPRNIVFMFGAIASGIACGVYGFEIALVGTLGFCLAAVILRFSPLGNDAELMGNLRIEFPKESFSQPDIESVLQQYCRSFRLDQLRFLNSREGTESSSARVEGMELNYVIRVKKNIHVEDLMKAVEEIKLVRNIRLRFNETGESL